MELWLFAIVLAAEALLLTALLISILLPDRRIWPPPGPRTWQFATVWGATAVAFAGSIGLAYADAGSFVFGAMGWKVGGGTLIVLGTALADWGVRTLTSHTSRGLGGEFKRRGPYRWSRNPQYLGHCMVVLGFMLAFDSALLVLTGLLGIACLVLTPLAEEPWLEERYGESYRGYRREVPRFLGRRRREAGDRARR
ncbi:MAG TPA: isoprenylcysteine carboxylmethyltransferase family protein [Gemmatimonadota bacterium]|nr:isoprenylcysteine carboxylmethyltransferase family protein [Gemmatimonadota bacterium]